MPNLVSFLLRIRTALAALILAEINDERRWETAFANSQEQLSKMADKVRDDIRAGRVRELGIDEL